MRRPHILRRATGKEACYHVIVFDTEASITKEGDCERHILRLGKLVYHRLSRDGTYRLSLSRYFTTPEEFWRILCGIVKRGKTYRVYAHNYHYDGIMIGLAQLSDYGFSIQRQVVDPDIFFIKAKYNGATVWFLDSTNYFKSPLSAMGAEIGLPKLTVDYLSVSDDELRTYLDRDVDILSHYVLHLHRFANDEDLGSVGLSAANFSMRAFRKKHYTGGIYIHTDERVLDLERASYYGGRTECFYLGDVSEKVTITDVKSMYPSVMRNNLYPTRLISYRENVTIDDISHLPADRCAIADVLIKTNIPFAPCRSSDGLIFPIGEFQTVLPTPELRYASEHGYIRRVFRLAVYQADDIFTQFVDYWFRRRQEYVERGQGTMAMLCKLIMNSLYGKFGQRRPTYREIDYPPISQQLYDELTEVDSETGITRHLRQIMGTVYVRESAGETDDSFPAIAAHVTSYARLKLWEFIMCAGMDNVLYMDTDSLFLLPQGVERLKEYIRKGELGYLEVKKTTSRLTIYGLKDYVLDYNPVRKGIRATAHQIDDATFSQEQFPSFVTTLRQGSTTELTVRPVVKHLARLYKKGIVTANGRVIPITLP